LKIGDAYSDLKDYSNAILSYTNALKINPMYANAYNNLGLVYFNIKDNEKAAKCYKKAYELDPKHKHAYINLGKLLSNQNQHD
jgi:tetratricopeptide (TPR) repeat protein